jgi:hypothetical protein
VPANYNAATVPELIDAIDAANLTPEPDTIVLAAATTFILTTVNNTANGAAALPTIAPSTDLTIFGNGSVIERSAATGTPVFRMFDVADGASLTLQNLTLQGGRAGSGGAIFNQGALTLKATTVQNNSAWIAGGGIYSNGSLTLENSLIQHNQALGVRGLDADCGYYGCTVAGNGGSAFGGGLYVGGGTALLTGVTISSNTAQGGAGGNAPRRNPAGNVGHGLGGGLYAAGGVVTLRDTSFTGNTAQGGAADKGAGATAGMGIGGGLYFEADVQAVIDALTITRFRRNKASTSDPNIAGPYTVG